MRVWAAAAGLIFAILASASPALALPLGQSGLTLSPEAESVDIDGDSGGRLADYALRLYEMKASGSRVRFLGRCDSACTLYLAMPSAAVCVAPGSYFRFHSPFGVSEAGVRSARAYMMQEYPRWVQSWLNAHGGLTSDLVTMSYEDARKHLRAC